MVWTDVIQITAMFGAMALVAIKGTLDVGGVGVVWQRNLDSQRIEYPKYSTVSLFLYFFTKYPHPSLTI